MKIPAGSTKIRLTDLTIECEESLKSKAPTKRKNYGRNTPRGVMVAIENSPRPSGRIQTPATMMKQAILPAENISPSEPNDDIRCRYVQDPSENRVPSGMTHLTNYLEAIVIAGAPPPTLREGNQNGGEPRTDLVYVEIVECI